VHLLFNNAGIQIPKAWDRMSEAEFDKVMAINCDGVITATRVFWPMLFAADEAAIVNTSSVAAFLPNAGGMCNPYAVSKAAVRGFSEHLAMDSRIMAPHITVSCVHPGAVNTEIVRKNVNMEEVDLRFAALTHANRACAAACWGKGSVGHVC
jgi:NAD(P)-dependent dehydrogenase (short-subunit alcohol dehydrogenase family)